MNNKFAKAILPAVVAVSSLGVGAALVAAPAGASTKAPITKSAAAAKKAPVAKSAPVTIAGTVTKVLAAKHTFWFTAGTKTYRAAYSSTTTFSKGSAAAIAKGLTVSVTGTYVGKSVTLIKATSIAA